MVLVDTDLLSIFAKIARLPLLFSVFNQDLLYFAAAVETEIQRGVALGFGFAGDIMTLHAQGRIQTLHPTTTDQHFMVTLSPRLDFGERESMAICKRLGATFASNERRVKHHCRENGIDCINLIEILRALWELDILTQAKVQTLITAIEQADNLRFRTTDPIFDESQ